MVTLPAELTNATLERMKERLARKSFPDFLPYVKVPAPQQFAYVPFQMWPHLVERAERWGAGDSEVILKARQIGLTTLAAAFAYWTAAYREAANVGIFSQGEAYAADVIRKIRQMWEQLPVSMQPVLKSDNVMELSWVGGGTISAFPSTKNAGSGRTFSLLIQDEASKHPYAAENYATVRATVADGGQHLIFSSANAELGPSGFFHDIYYASKRRETTFTAVFVPRSARPDRGPEWLERERMNYAVQGIERNFQIENPETDTQAFTSVEGLVYPMFSEARHVRPAPCPWADCKRRFAGVDWGGGDPTAVGVYGVTGTGRIHQYAEFHRTGPVSVTEIADFLIEWDRKGTIRAVMCDPSEPVSIETLNRGALLGRVKKANNRRSEGLPITAMLLEQDRLTIDPSCPFSIAEFYGYRWAERTDQNDNTKYRTKTPVDNHADHMDDRRYALHEAMRYELGTGRVIGSSGRKAAYAV